jgi:chromosomal replication initiator protein
MVSVALEQTFLISLPDSIGGYFSGDSTPIGGFDNGRQFVGDESNAALRYVVDSEQMLVTDWPLVFTGPSGTGKTLLAAYVAADVASKSRPTEAIFWTAAEFSGRFRAVCETDSVAEWRRRLADTSCLVIDDLDKLDTHPSAQQELVQVLDLLGQNFVPLICTASQKFLQSDRILSQLGSRLSGGLCLTVQPPGLFARREIIDWWLHEMRLNLTEDAREYLAQQMNVTAPKIRHFLVQLGTWLKSNKSVPVEVELDLIRRFHEHFLMDSSKHHSEAIVRCVAAAFKLKPREVKSSSRKQTIVLARAIAIYLQRKHLRLSFAKIGSNFGGRDHSTIVHANKKIKSIVNNDSSGQADTRYLIAQLEQQITEQMAVGPKGPE